jgi:hypothetical protein
VGGLLVASALLVRETARRRGGARPAPAAAGPAPSSRSSAPRPGRGDSERAPRSGGSRSGAVSRGRGARASTSDHAAQAAAPAGSPAAPRRRPSEPLLPASGRFRRPAERPARATADAEPATCTIRLHTGLRRAQFYAIAFRPDGTWVRLGQSSPFTVNGEGAQARTPEAAARLEELEHRLEEEGWTPAGSGRTWYELQFERARGSG